MMKVFIYNTGDFLRYMTGLGWVGLSGKSPAYKKKDLFYTLLIIYIKELEY
jgi:hypothetical protein